MIRLNGKDSAYIDETVGEMLERLEIQQRGVAVAVDGEIICRSQWPSTRIVDHNVVEIVTAAAGG